MLKGPDLRKKARITYTISDDSDELGSSSGTASVFSSPKKVKRTRNIIDLEDDDDDEDDDVEEFTRADTPRARFSTAGHSLRQHKDLHLSLRAQENGDKPLTKKRKKLVSRSKLKISKLVSDAPGGHVVVRTARNQIRDFIATETTSKRARFFASHKDYFLPLLPEHNHVNRIVQRFEQNDLAAGEEDQVIPYESIETQPDGYVVLTLVIHTGSNVLMS